MTRIRGILINLFVSEARGFATTGLTYEKFKNEPVENLKDIAFKQSTIQIRRTQGIKKRMKFNFVGFFYLKEEPNMSHIGNKLLAAFTRRHYHKGKL